MENLKNDTWYVYIIECTNKNLYTGITKSVHRRFSEHKQGIGAKYFRIFPPEKIVFVEKHEITGSVNVTTLADMLDTIECHYQDHPTQKRITDNES